MVDTAGRRRVLVVAAPEYQAALEPLLQYRRTQYDVEVVDLDTARRHHPDVSAAEALRAYARDRYVEATVGPLAAILLVGDDTAPDTPTEIPIGRYPATTEDPTPRATDDAYGDLTNDPGVEVPVGRLPVRSRADVEVLVAKQLAYETQPVPLNRHTIGIYGGRAHFGAVIDAVIEAKIAREVEAIPAHYPRRAQAEDPASRFHVPGTDIFSLLNAGAFIVTVASHGAPDRLLIAPSLDLSTAAAIDITGHLPILNLLACSAGCFAEQECLGERLLLQRRGPIAVFGSNDVIHPVNLDPFGTALAHALSRHGQTVGEVFYAAKRQVAAANTLTARVLAELPPALQRAARLTGSVAHAARVDAGQMTLLGDPLTPFETFAPAPPEGQPHDRSPATLHDRAERIVLGATAGQAGKGIDSRFLDRDDAVTVLTVADHLLASVTQRLVPETWGPLVQRALRIRLPQPGEIALREGLFSMPATATIPTTLLPATVRNRLLGPSADRPGTIQVEHLRFRLTLHQGQLGLHDIDGIEIAIDGQRMALRAFTIDLTQSPDAWISHPTLETVHVDAAPPSVTSLHAQLDAAFTGTLRLQIERDVATPATTDDPRFVYTLRQAMPGNHREMPRLAWLHAVRLDHPPRVTSQGAILPVGFGQEPIGIETQSGETRLVIRSQPPGARKANYLYIPAGEVASGSIDPTELAAIRAALGLKRAPVLIPIGQHIPLYAVALLPEDFIDTTQDLSRLERPSEEAPLFRERPEAPTAAATAATARSTTRADASPAADISHLPTGAEFCVVVDASGSAGYPLMTAWPLVPQAIDELLSPYNALIQGIIKMRTTVSVVTTPGTTPQVVLDRETLSGNGLDRFAQTIGDIVFRGAQTSLADGVALCRRQLTPHAPKGLIQGIVVLTDPSGAAAASLAQARDVHLQVVTPELAARGVTLGAVSVQLTHATKADRRAALVAALAGSGLSADRIATITETLADVVLPWDGAGHSEATRHRQLTDQLIAQLRTDDMVALYRHLTQALQAFRAEPALEAIVAAVPLLPDLYAMQLLPNLADPLDARHDAPLRLRTIATLGALAQRGSDEALRMLHTVRDDRDPSVRTAAHAAIERWRRSGHNAGCGTALAEAVARDPWSVRIEELRQCGPKPDTMRAVWWLLQYGTVPQQAMAITLAGEFVAGRTATASAHGEGEGDWIRRLRMALLEQALIGVHRAAACHAVGRMDQEPSAFCEEP